MGPRSHCTRTNIEYLPGPAYLDYRRPLDHSCRLPHSGGAFAGRESPVRDLDGSYRGVRVAVLGASGFIGRWVSRKLCAAGACPYLVVRDPESAATTLSQYGVSGELLEADLSNTSVLGEIYSRIRPAITFNLVGYGVDVTERDEAVAYQINAGLPGDICEAAAAWKDPNWSGQQIVHAGSALEYGDIGGDLREDSGTHPTTVYGISKLKGTRSIAKGCAALGLRGLTARLFTVYGPGEHAGRLLPSLIETSRTRQPLELTAGTQRRDFTYVEDVADGLLRLGLAVTVEQGEVINLATGRLVSVRSFIEIAASTLKIPASNLRFGALPARLDEMEHGDISIDRLRRVLCWVPSTSIEEGLRASIC
jgi:UDP-glucose 4-epimerase